MFTNINKFWRTVKPLLSEESLSNTKIALIEYGEGISLGNETVDVLNTLFSNIVSNQSSWISHLKSLL